MNLNEYATQFDPIITALEKVQESFDNDCAGDTEEEWATTYGQVIGSCASMDVQIITSAMQEASEQTGNEAKARTFVSHLLEHFNNQKAMTTQTSNILGQFGVKGIKFV